MKRVDYYEAPSVEILEVVVETGFVASDGNSSGEDSDVTNGVWD